MVEAVAVEFAGGWVGEEDDIAAGFVAGAFDCFHDECEWCAVTALCEAWAVAAFVADSGGVAAFFEDFAESVEDFGANADSVLEGFGADWHEHVFLDLSAPVGVGAAVHDVYHGAREGEVGVFGEVGEVTEERDGFLVGGGFGVCERNSEDGVCAEGGFVLSGVEVDHDLVEGVLVSGVAADEGVFDVGVDVIDGFFDAFAAVFGFVAVTEFESFAGASGSARWNCGAANSAAFEDDVCFDGGVATRVENLACGDVFDAEISWVHVFYSVDCLI